MSLDRSSPTPTPSTDAQHGAPLDPEALRSHDRALRYYTRRATGCRHLADDAVQDVWLEFLEHPPASFDRLPGWLRVAARHALVRRRGQDTRRRDRELAVARAPMDAPRGASGGSDLVRWVERGVEELGSPYREVLRLRLFEELSGAEIAERLGRSENTVRSQTRRGLQRLRDKLGHGRFRLLGLGALLAAIGRPRRGTRAVVTGLPVAAALALVSLLLLGSRDPRDGRAPTPLVGVAEPDLVAIAPAGHTLADPMDAPLAPSRQHVPTSPPPGVASVNDGVEVIGEVTEAGAPRFGARIYATADRRAEERTLLGTSDSSGRFTVRVADEAHWIWAELDGALPSARHLVSSLRGDHQRVAPLSVGDSLGFVRVAVRDSLDRPVPGASVRLAGGDRVPDWNAAGHLVLPPPPTLASADAGGVARVALPSNHECRLTVHAAGFARHVESGRFRSAPETGEVVVHLQDGASLAGSVRTSRGEPVPGARVSVTDASREPVAATRTDALGRFRLDALPRESLRIVAGGAPPYVGSDQGLIDLRVPSSEALDLVLRDDHSVHGVAMAGARPLVGWRVAAWPEPVHPARSPQIARTDEQGSFRLDGLFGGAQALYLFEPGDLRVPRVHVSGVAPGRKAGVRLDPEQSPSTASLRGHWMQAAHVVGDETRLELSGPGLPAPLVLGHLRADRALHRGALPAGDYELHGASAGYGRYRLAAFSLGAGEHLDLGTLSAPAPASLSVRVLAPDGTPAPRALARLTGTGVDLRSPRRDRDAEAAPIRFAQVPPGHYKLTVRARGCASHQEQLELRPGSTSRVDVRLEPGRVVDVRVVIPMREAGGVCSWSLQELVDGRPRTLVRASRIVEGAGLDERLRPRLRLGDVELLALTSDGLECRRRLRVDPDAALDEVLLVLE